MVDNRFDTQHDRESLRRARSNEVEDDYGTAIDELTARRDALVERKSQVVLTDAQIAEIISEVSE